MRIEQPTQKTFLGPISFKTGLPEGVRAKQDQPIFNEDFSLYTDFSGFDEHQRFVIIYSLASQLGPNNKLAFFLAQLNVEKRDKMMKASGGKLNIVVTPEEKVLIENLMADWKKNKENSSKASK